MKFLARGRAAEVFEHSPGRVLRRYFRPENTAREAAVMAYARERGYPIPAVEVLSDTEMLLEKIDGPTMLEDLVRRPWLAGSHARTLAGLHRRLHAIEAPPWLDAFGEGGALLHLDLHPANVMLGTRGPVVIDWPNARRGAGEADVAYAWLIMATSDTTGTPRPLLVAAIRGLFVRAFLSHFDRGSLEGVLPLCARARTADLNVHDSERMRIRRLARI